MNEIIKNLVDKLHQYLNNPNQKTIITIKEKIQLKEVYRQLFKSNPNVGCDSCVRHYLTQLEAWYQRQPKPEPKPEPKPQTEAQTEIQPTEQIQDKPKDCVKCKKSKSSK
jgi:hypothetical protein